MTTRRLMIIIVLVALGGALLRFVLHAWGAVELETLSILILLASIFFAAFPTGKWRGFWVGSALLGWGYWCLAEAPWSDPPITEHLPTTWLIDGLFNRLEPIPPQPSDDFGASIFESKQRADRFRRGGHSLIGLLFAIMGGLGGYRLSASWARSDNDTDPPDGSLLRPRTFGDPGLTRLRF